MGSKGRMPPHLRRPLPGSGMMHPDPFAPGIRPPPGPFLDMLPPPEIMDQKLNMQHMEMQRLAIENQRLAETHVTLRHELAAAQQELQRLQGHISVMKMDKEQQMRGLLDKMAMMETDLQASEPVKVELHRAHAEAQNLIAAREELISKGQQLTQDLQKSHSDVQKIPALVSELEALRQEYQDCRVTYDYEKKLYNNHLESLQVMEKNYVSMAREVEKLRAELANASSIERSAGQYGGNTGYKENDASVHQPVGQNAYNEGYGVPQGRGPPSGGAASYGGGPPAAVWGGYDATKGVAYDASRGSAGDASRAATYDASRAATYDASRAATYDAPRGGAYDASRGPSYDPTRGAASDASRGANYDPSRGMGYDTSIGASYDASRATGYEAQRAAGYDASRAAGVAQAPVAPGNINAPYGLMPTPTRAGEVPARAGEVPARPGELPARGGNAARR